MGLQKKDGSRHAIGALAVIISSLFGARRLNPHTFVSTYSYLYPFYHLLCIGHLATYASNSLNLTFLHSVPLKKSAMTSLPLTCIKSILLSIPNPTLTHSRNQSFLAPASTDHCDLSYLSQWLLPLSPPTASMTVTLVLNPIFQVSHLPFVS